MASIQHFRGNDYIYDVKCIKPMSSPHMVKQGKLFGIKGKQFDFGDSSVESVSRNQIMFQIECQIRVLNSDFVQEDFVNALGDHLLCNCVGGVDEIYPNGFPADRGIGNISLHCYSTGRPEYMIGHNRPYYQYLYVEVTIIVGEDGLEYTKSRQVINKAFDVLTRADAWYKGIPYEIPGACPDVGPVDNTREFDETEFSDEFA